MTRSEILATASQLVTDDRARTHGDARKNFELIAGLWEVYLDHPISPADVGMMMALLKIARGRGNPASADSYLDLAGYAALAGELATEGKNG
jgi:hypothetical protein